MTSQNPGKAAGALDPAKAFAAAELVNYGEGAVVSRTLRKGSTGTMTVFAFDAGQELSEHTAPFDAYVLILDGEAVLTIGGEPVQVKAGELALMPADVPHAVNGPGRFKMLLVMYKG